MVHVLDLDPVLGEEVGQVLGHLFGQGGHQYPLVSGGALVDLAQQVLDLALHRLDDDLGVQKAGGTDHLLGHPHTVLPFVFTGRCAHEHNLVQLAFHLLEF